MFRKLAVTLAATLFSVSASYAGDLVRLGDRSVGFINDHDTIHVGHQDGRFKRLKLVVRRNDIKLNGIKVFFANGEVEDVAFDHMIHDGGDAVIDLPTAGAKGALFVTSNCITTPGLIFVAKRLPNSGDRKTKQPRARPPLPTITNG